MKILVSGAKPHHLQPPARQGDVGYDLVNDEYRAIRPLQHVTLRTGVRVGFPPGIWGRIIGRSSTFVKRGLLVVDSTIDTGYTGDLTVQIINMGQQVTIVQPGERLAQLILQQAVIRPIMVVEELDETERGDAGFGSTGT